MFLQLIQQGGAAILQCSPYLKERLLIYIWCPLFAQLLCDVSMDRGSAVRHSALNTVAGNGLHGHAPLHMVLECGCTCRFSAARWLGGEDQLIRSFSRHRRHQLQHTFRFDDGDKEPDSDTTFQWSARNAAGVAAAAVCAMLANAAGLGGGPFFQGEQVGAIQQTGVMSCSWHLPIVPCAVM